MTTKEWAKLLDGRQRCDEITSKESNRAKSEGIVIVYGASDDLCELQGAISDEASCYCGRDGRRTIQFAKTGKLFDEPDSDEWEVLTKFGVHELVRKDTASFEAMWCVENGLSWTYNVPFPHETFNIMEDGEIYCRGFVFKLEDAFSDKGIK